MKQAIFKNKKGGWYIYGSNYKDKSDVAYLNLFFPKNSEPKITDNKTIIDIQEAKFTSFNKQLGLTIFKYDQYTNNEFESIYNTDTQEIDESKFGNTYADIKSDDLPFY